MQKSPLVESLLARKGIRFMWGKSMRRALPHFRDFRNERCRSRYAVEHALPAAVTARSGLEESRHGGRHTGIFSG